MKNIRNNKWNKIKYKILYGTARLTKLVSESSYKKKYKKLLKDYGMDIAQDEYYIDPTVYFDNYDYSLIHIAEKVTISREVLFLTHDYSLYVGFNAMGSNKNGYFLNGISIEENCFIGARVVILPGTHLGKNSIVGAGAVIKGNIPDNSIVVGNPARIIANSIEWGKKHGRLKDYMEI